MSVRRTTPYWTLGLMALLGAKAARADQFHYNNVLVGTRAVGMGGAFGAVADDASGVYYNPAGLAFALSNDIQGSANAFYKKKTTYEKTLGSEAFEEESSGSLSPFFGGLQKLDRHVEGLVFAFGVYTVDSDLKDQDTLIESKSVGEATIDRYHRTSNARAGTYYVGAAVGYRPMPNLAFGLGLNYYNSDELVQEFQYARQSLPGKKFTDGQPMWRVLASNVREHLTVYGFQPVLGVQMALPAGLAAGLTVKKGFIASENFEYTGESSAALVTEAQADQMATPAGVTGIPMGSTGVVEKKEKKPLGDLPAEVRLGFAWFASPTILVAFDTTYYSAITTGTKNIDGIRSRYNREAVMNYSLGTEIYAAPSFPVRFGVFTNNDSRPEVQKGTVSSTDKTQTCGDEDFAKKYCGQPDHIDYLGGSLFIAWVQPNSQISGGFVLQNGTGKAQKLGDHQVQDVKSQQYQFAFSATHNL